MFQRLKVIFHGWDESIIPDDRKFGLVFTSIFFIVAVTLAFIEEFFFAFAFSVLGLIFLVVSMVAPTKLHQVNRAWTFLGFILSLIVSPIIMMAIYFGVVSPLALICRVMSRDVLELKKFGDGKHSCWKSPDSRLQNSDHFSDQF